MYAPTACAELELCDESDRSLIDRTLRGEHSAFEELVLRYQDRLFINMLRLCRSRDVAEEIVQDAFVQAYVKLDTFRHQAAFFSWLFRIAFNKFLCMKRKKRITLSLEDLTDMHSQPVDPTDSAEQRISRNEDRARVAHALQRLEPNSRSILQLREMDGMSYEEISQELNIKMGTVRSRLSRARSKLHHELVHD